MEYLKVNGSALFAVPRIGEGEYVGQALFRSRESADER